MKLHIEDPWIWTSWQVLCAVLFSTGALMQSLCNSVYIAEPQYSQAPESAPGHEQAIYVFSCSTTVVCFEHPSGLSPDKVLTIRYRWQAAVYRCDGEVRHARSDLLCRCHLFWECTRCEVWESNGTASAKKVRNATRKAFSGRRIHLAQFRIAVLH